MASFDEILNGLHSSVVDAPTAQSNIIVVDEKRQFTPVDFDTVIAYEGDINSQIITFQLPKTHEGHELSGCTDQILKWKNLASGIEGTFNLKDATVEGDAEHFYRQWEVAPEAFSLAGNIEISISFYDYTDDSKTLVSFSWNTPTYAGLSVGKANEQVGYHFPAKNEILMVDKETKQILAPVGYNNTVCNFGDIGVANIYFLVNRYLGKNEDLDVMLSEITLHLLINGYREESTLSSTSYRLYSPEMDDRYKEGMVFIDWEVPAEYTADEKYGACSISISIEFTIKEGETIRKRWFSNSYSSLNIAPSALQVEESPGQQATTNEVVYKMISDYFEENEIIWDSN